MAPRSTQSANGVEFSKVNHLLTILQGDCIDQLRTLPDESVHCCVTSPPYWGLRDYGVAGQIGLEPTPQEYVSKMVSVFREVRRVLRGDATCWVNLGDSYASNAATAKGNPGGFESYRGSDTPTLNTDKQGRNAFRSKEIKPKDLCGIPWRVAFALQADGWWLRSEIIWHKPNPMPESVTDRPTKAHEQIFLLAKSERYWYDAEAIREPNETGGEFITEENKRGGWRPNGGDDSELVGGKVENGRKARADGKFPRLLNPNGRSKRSVWTVATNPYSEAHFATFPPDLIKPCILAGCPVGGTVLDPFGGSGTTGQVALEYGRKAILIELNPKYVELMRNRTNVTPGFCFT